MSVIVSANGVFATDKQHTKGTLKYPTQKLLSWNGYYYCYVGEHDEGQQLIRWFKNGQNVEDFPVFDHEGFVTTLVTCDATNGFISYEGDPIPIKFGWTTHAWGCGAMMALGAVYSGSTAVEAVELVNQHNIYCGFGVDSVKVRKE